MNTEQIINRLNVISNLIDDANAEQTTIAELKKKSDSKDRANAYSGYGYEYNFAKKEINKHLVNLDELINQAFEDIEQLINDLRNEGNE